MTVLFADVSGFTSLSERLDPEDVRAFQNDLFKMFAEVIEQYGGFVEKFVGDAVMAVFGAPVAHEDDPERALRAALLMLDRAQLVSARWEICFGGPVKLHLGINTGRWWPADSARPRRGVCRDGRHGEHGRPVALRL